MRRSDAAAKLAGTATFGTDLDRPGMLWGALVPSPLAHGRLTRVDLASARRARGVVAAVGPEDLRSLLPGGGSPERPVFPPSELMYIGQPVAAIAARTLPEAREAARAVRVEAEPLPLLPELDERFPEWPTRSKTDAPGIVAHVHARHGDLEAAFRSADRVHRETYRTSGIHQVALEPHACLAEVGGGRWRVTTTTQTPFGVREDAAEILGLTERDLVVEGTWVGGGFGGKGAAFLEPYALLLAAASGRPVRLSLSYGEEFRLGRSTLPSVIRIESSLRNGRLTGRRVRLLLDSGSSLPGRDFATGYSIGFLLGPYRLPAFEMEGYAVRTNKPPFGPHRAPFAPQCVFALESHTDELARAAGIDPVEFRLANVWRTGDATHFGAPVGPFGAEAALRAAQETILRWRGAPDRPIGRGIGVGLGFWSTGTGAGGEARVRLTPDTIVVEVGEREIGSGSVTVGLVAVAARALGVAGERIQLDYGDTDHAPFDTGVFGSRTVGALGQAVEVACRKLVGLLSERAGAPVALRWSDGHWSVQAGGTTRPVGSLLTPEERAAGGLVVSGRHFGTASLIDEARVVEGSFYGYHDLCAAVHACEVEVDPETGTVRVLRSSAFHDVGTTIDPAMLRGQIEGGVAMGLGEALTEETIWSRDGRIVNPSLLDYRIPTLLEVPPIEVVPIEGFGGAGPYGAKGIGEPPIIPVPAAVANAVANAVGARLTELPLTPERVARAVKPWESRGAE